MTTADPSAPGPAETEIHEPTVERFRRDVCQYRCQPEWLDAWSVMRMFDQLRADLSAARERLAACEPLLAAQDRFQWCWDCGTSLVDCAGYRPERKCCPDCRHRRMSEGASDARA